MTGFEPVADIRLIGRWPSASVMHVGSDSCYPSLDSLTDSADEAHFPASGGEMYRQASRESRDGSTPQRQPHLPQVPRRRPPLAGPGIADLSRRTTPTSARPACTAPRRAREAARPGRRMDALRLPTAPAPEDVQGRGKAREQIPSRTGPGSTGGPDSTGGPRPMPDEASLIAEEWVRSMQDPGDRTLRSHP